jgi:hypothetical protein
LFAALQQISGDFLNDANFTSAKLSGDNALFSEWCHLARASHRLGVKKLTSPAFDFHRALMQVCLTMHGPKKSIYGDKS